jgi:hypothetical protein
LDWQYISLGLSHEIEDAVATPRVENNSGVSRIEQRLSKVKVEVEVKE